MYNNVRGYIVDDGELLKGFKEGYGQFLRILRRDGWRVDMLGGCGSGEVIVRGGEKVCFGNSQEVTLIKAVILVKEVKEI